MHTTASKEVAAREIIRGLHAIDCRNLARNREVTTAFQAALYVHRCRSRQLSAVRVSGLGQWTADEQATIQRVHQLLKSQRLVQVDLQVCATEPSYHVRLYVPLAHADLAYMAGRAMLAAPAEKAGAYRADATAIVMPEWSESRAVLIDTDHATSYVLGSDYYGDIHNSVLYLVGQAAAKRGLLSLHAGSMRMKVRSAKDGTLRDCGLLIFGAGGAGKTSLVTHDYGLDAAVGEMAAVRQDDRVILHMDGRVQGTEGLGLYVRTLGLNPQERPGLWQAVNHEDAVLENVWVGPDGVLDYASEALTSNGRAIAPLGQIPGFDGQIDVPCCTHAFFLCDRAQSSASSMECGGRDAALDPSDPASNPFDRPYIQSGVDATALHSASRRIVHGDSAQDEGMPSGAKLTASQAADLLRRTEEASPEELAAKAEAFEQFLRQNPDVQCFAICTGTIGQGPSARKVTLAESARAILNICREGAVS